MAWDLLLELLRADKTAQRISVSALSISVPHISPTTALRVVIRELVKADTFCAILIRWTRVEILSRWGPSAARRWSIIWNKSQKNWQPRLPRVLGGTATYCQNCYKSRLLS